MAEELSVLLSVFVTPFELTVTEQEINAPLGAKVRSQAAEGVAVFIVNEVCVVPLINKLYVKFPGLNKAVVLPCGTPLSV